MPSIQELRERQRKEADEILQMRDEFHRRKAEKKEGDGKEGEDLWGGAEGRKRWDDINARYNATTKELEREEQIAEVAARSAEIERERGRRNAPPGDKKPGQDDFNGRRDDRRDNPEQRERDFSTALGVWSRADRDPGLATRNAELMTRVGIDPNARSLEFNLSDTLELRQVQEHYERFHASVAKHRAMQHVRESRALSAYNAANGAVLVPSTLIGEIETNMLAVGGIERFADIMVTDTGEEISWPSGDDTSNEGHIVGENVAKATTNDPTFKGTKWGAHEFTSDIVLVPNRLFDDNAAGLARWLAEALGQRIGRGANRKFTSGTGNAQPMGALTAATLGKTTASGSAITGDEIIDLEHSVDPAYREDPSFAFMMHDNVIAYARKLKDSQNRYLWSDGLRDNVPDRLNGRRLGYNQHMDSAVATTNKTILCGAWRFYKIRRVKTIVLTKLVERYAEYNQTAFVAILRQDGNLMDPGTAPLKYMLQA